MRKLSLALAAAAALVAASPATAADIIVPEGGDRYVISGTDVSGEFGLIYLPLLFPDDPFRLGDLQLTIGSLTFDLNSSGFDDSNKQLLIIGGNNCGGPSSISASCDSTDFLFMFDTTANVPQIQSLLYRVGDELGLHSVEITISLAPDGPAAGGVPEPASWAMMLLGFAGMGLAMRRRKSATAIA